MYNAEDARNASSLYNLDTLDSILLDDILKQIKKRASLGFVYAHIDVPELGKDWGVMEDAINVALDVLKERGFDVEGKAFSASLYVGWGLS